MTESDPPPSPTPAPSPAAPTPDVLKGALKAFKKRMKLTHLDKESGKMAGPLSGGKVSNIVAISPPHQYPREVWEELVKQGKLKYDGYGLYKLADGV